MAYLIAFLSVCKVWVAVVGPARGSYTEKSKIQGHTLRQHMPQSVKSDVYYTQLTFI